MARYLLAASPLHGHVRPMLSIAADLAGRGHRVRLLTGVRFTDAAREAGVTHLPLPARCDFDDRDIDRAFPARRTKRGLDRARCDMDLLFTVPMAAQYEALEHALAAESADAVLVEVGFVGALPLLLGQATRPPVLVCGVVPLTLSSRDTAPFGMGWPPGRWPRDHRGLNRVVHSLMFRGNQARANRALATCGAGRLPVFVLDWPRLADRLLQLTVSGFEYPRADLPSAVGFVGPVLSSADAHTASLPEWWPELIADPRPIVHVTQGTLDNNNLDRVIGPTIRGLADEDVLVVAATGGRPVEAVPVGSPNSRLAEFVPYHALLPRVDVMVTNGGYGGVQHALAHGVPLVVAGDTEDKREVAARVRWSGTGIDLRTGTPTPAQLRAAVRTALREPGYRSQARRLQAAISATDALGAIAAALPPGRDRG